MSERIRKFFFWTHLCLGLIAGVFVLVMCVTGILAAYRPQLETLLNHWGVSSQPPSPGARPLPIEVLAERVRRSTGADPQSVTVYSGSGKSVDFYLGRRAGTVYTDAFTGAIIGRPSRQVFRFFGQVNNWHGSLGVNGPNHELGTAIMDAANFVCLYLAVFGLYLWLPRRWTWRHFRAGLVFRTDLGGKARDFNWHNVIGFWTLVPLVVMVWTGVALSYSWAGEATVRALSHLPAPPAASGFRALEMADSDADPDPFVTRVAGLGALLERAKLRVPDWKSIDFDIPDFMAAPVTFTLDPTGARVAKGSLATRLQLARTGEELSFRPPPPMRGRSIYRFSHTGEMWGFWGQTVAMLGCLGGVFLVWTGISLSIRRFAAWLGRRRRSKERAGSDLQGAKVLGTPSGMMVR
jgi:uncharacterized iron-regulated membrane protein